MSHWCEYKGADFDRAWNCWRTTSFLILLMYDAQYCRR